MWSAGAVARKMRTVLDVCKRPACARLARSACEEQRRYEQAKGWSRHPPSWWEKSIHTYIDNNVFVLARSEKDKKLMSQECAAYHLQRRSEGVCKGCVVPKTERKLHGMLSVDVAAAVARGWILMWNVNTRPWSRSSALRQQKVIPRW